MKKIILTTALLLVTIITLQRVNHKDNSEHFTELMRLNIESLATPENPNVICFFYGSVDCPTSNIQVAYYY